MLPQPSFGPGKGPDDDDDADRPPKQIGRLRLVLWVQTAFAVLAGNYMILSIMAFRNTSPEEYARAYNEAAESEDQHITVAEAARILDGFDAVPMWIIAGLMLIGAILSALVAIRLKHRLKSARRLGIAASLVLLLLAMFTVLFMPGFFFVLMIWVFASILALWWLFSSDVKHWMTE
jgi:hypothetical protein